MTPQGAGDERDQRWMRRALILARRGQGATRPNPMVGAVLVRDGRRLAEGFHRRAGTPHAEIDALAKLKPGDAAGATLYVTLEPCSHTGRTGPCTTALLHAGISRVVLGVRDPNPLVNGRGIARLRRAGIRVDVGCLDRECRELNRPFFLWVTAGRPLVTLKAAATLDGFIADRAPRTTRAPAWITGAEARAAAHLLRREHDAILVGAGTVVADDPRLTVRLPGPVRSRRAARPRGAERRQETSDAAPQLLRVILDGRLRIPATSAALRSVAGAKTLVVGAIGAPPARVAALERSGAEVLLLPATRGGRVDPARLLTTLARRDVQSVLVEGGAQVHAAFIAAGLVDRIALFFAPRLLGGGVPIASAAGGVGLPLAHGLVLGPLSVRRLGHDLLVRGDVQGGAGVGGSRLL